MSVARDPAPTAQKVSFEVDRFEWVAHDRLELAGRWYGVRGRRFLRPTLDVEMGDQRRRMLALLEHKPWTAVDGEQWLAAFSWEGEQADLTAELSVGPDLAVGLPQPGTSSTEGHEAAPRQATTRASGVTGKVPVERREAHRPRSDALEREAGAARAQAQRATEELDRVRSASEAQMDRMRGELEAAQQSRHRLEAELQGARDEVEAKQAAVDRQREELHRERDAAVTERDAALADARQFKRERDAALRDRTTIEHDRDAAIEARDRALQDNESSLSGVQAVAAERDTAAAERDAVRAERDSVVAERDAARQENRPSVSIGPTAQRGGPTVTMSPIVAGSRGPTLGPRLIALAVLVVFAAIVALVLITAIG